MRTTPLVPGLALALFVSLAGCRAKGPTPPSRDSPAMQEASFVLGTMRDPTAAEVVVGVPDPSGLVWQLRRLDGDHLVDLPGASVGLLSSFRVLAAGDIALWLADDVARYDGTTLTTLPMSGAPATEQRHVLAVDTRPSTGETFLIMSPQFASEALFCHGVAALSCAPLAGVAAPDRAELVATEAHVYVTVDGSAGSSSTYDVDASGIAHALGMPLIAMRRAGDDHVLAQSAMDTVVIADDGTSEDLGAGHFEGLGPAGEILRLDRTAELEGYDCPRTVSCGPPVSGAMGYVQYVVFRREGAAWVEHAHVDLVDAYSDDAHLTLLPDRRLALTAHGVSRTFLAPALP